MFECPNLIPSSDFKAEQSWVIAEQLPTPSIIMKGSVLVNIHIFYYAWSIKISFILSTLSSNLGQCDLSKTLNLNLVGFKFILTIVSLSTAKDTLWIRSLNKKKSVHFREKLSPIWCFQVSIAWPLSELASLQRQPVSELLLSITAGFVGYTESHRNKRSAA